MEILNLHAIHKKLADLAYLHKEFPRVLLSELIALQNATATGAAHDGSRAAAEYALRKVTAAMRSVENARDAAKTYALKATRLEEQARDLRQRAKTFEARADAEWTQQFDLIDGRYKR